ncbi:AraC family transcriptional regulator [Runella sp. CRIBMP]|jgi:AraC family transcriptional regulator|uniref:AraC family transcriptional regulator n=1 Tax=Runella aurantiaca TaxID=2282308 RepID=A0A369I8D9_9BACT|nr:MULTISPECIES: AraC family transcriptional regulator [Runella]NBB19287.1 AraC family transcriptional regulator [Runella sp. CRIBMP]RDB06019.1 AraC family transcriptional regulator [Runella aurantiaca]
MNSFNLSHHLQSRKLELVVENRTAYTLENAELNIYETHQIAKNVELTFSNPVLASMIRGKKVMHLDNSPSFDFLPGESVIVPADQTMRIDFPEAHFDNPTQCLALAISPSKIKQIVETLNEKAPLVDNQQGWQFTNENFYFTNENSIHLLIHRLIYIFTENNEAKDFFANLVLQELIVRLMQTKARNVLTNHLPQLANTNRLAFAVKYVQDNIHKNLTVRELADKACMSEPNFFRCFKQQYGITPVEYINQQRIQLSIKLLRNTQYSIADICFACGYNNLNYFLKVFKKAVGTTPANYRRQFIVF